MFNLVTILSLRVAIRTHYTSVRTHKKFLLSQAFKWKGIMFFVVPEMPSKTFVVLYKKLPDHFNNMSEVKAMFMGLRAILLTALIKKPRCNVYVYTI